MFVYISVINPYFTKYAPSLSNASVIVINKTDKVIYVDKGPSFFYTNNLPPESMFGSKSTLTGTTQSSGVGVNLGGLASAFGAKGSASSVLNSVTVYNSTGVIDGTIQTEKRIIPIAPNGASVVYTSGCTIGYGLVASGHANYSIGMNVSFRLVENGEKIKLNKGEERQYNEQNTILSYKAVVHYAFTEDMKDYREATTGNYLKAIVSDSSDGVKNEKSYKKAKLMYCEKYKNAPNEYTLFQAKQSTSKEAF